jgi:NADH-quinone oxidoreductase subunit I
MFGQGIAKGLLVTLKHFVATYANDVKRGGRAYLGDSLGDTIFERRQGTRAKGIYTVEYPDEKIAVPERFRFVPFLVVENHDHPDRPGHDWCTSCGICAKVCPPQCIWIVRGEDPVTKRPIPEPQAFYIDIDICMNCGYCAEFCPFDAIKMDHDYELANYDRTTNNIHDKARLSKEFRYWQSIAPTTAAEEAEARGGWEHSDVIKERKKAEAAAKKAAPAPAAPAAASNPPVTGQQAAESEAAAAVAANVEATARAEATTQEPASAAAEDAEAAKAERLAKREAALARKAAKKKAEGGE